LQERKSVRSSSLEQIIQLWGDPQVERFGTGKWTDEDGEHRGPLGVPLYLDELPPDKFFERPFKGRARDVREFRQVIVTDRAMVFAFTVGEPPEPEVYCLL